MDTSRTLRIAVYSTKNQHNETIDAYASISGLKVEQVLCPSQEEQVALLQEGKVDAIYATEMSIPEYNTSEPLRPLMLFSPTPFYFATTKGNTELINSLNYGIATLNKVNDDFAEELFNRYFGYHATNLYLSDEEKRYIENTDVVRVAVVSFKPPLQYVDKNSGEIRGIVIDLCNLISEKTGLRFEYVVADSQAEYDRLIEEGKADISADMMSDYAYAAQTNCSLTASYTDFPICIVAMKDTDMQRLQGKIIAMPYFLKNIISISDDQKVIYFDSIHECLEAVRDKKADYCYAGVYCTQYNLNYYEYTDMIYIVQPSMPNYKLSLGLHRPVNLELLSILNKTLQIIPSETVQEFIYSNSYQKQPLTFTLFLQKYKWKLIFGALLIILVFMGIYLRAKQKSSRLLALENERYNKLSELSRDYFYEYDLRVDTLTLQPACAEYFNIEPVIPEFSKKLEKMGEDLHGIWKLGKHMISTDEEIKEVQCEYPSVESPRWYRITSSRVYGRDGSIPVYMIGKIVDIHLEKTEQIHLEQQAAHDSLTGIYNVAYSKEKISRILEEDNAAGALLIIDIDYFKLVNDRFGHYNGDAVLIQIAGLMGSVFDGGKDVIGRLGGDEFLVFIKDVLSRERIAEKCEQLCRDAAQKTTAILGTPVTLSIGAVLVQKGQKYDDLYKAADSALYTAKSNGRNTFHILF